MKKRILLLSVLMTLGVATFLSSCKKDKEDKEKRGVCVCDIYHGGEYIWQNNYGNMNSSSCSDLSGDVDGYYYDCYITE